MGTISCWLFLFAGYFNTMVRRWMHWRNTWGALALVTGSWDAWDSTCEHVNVMRSGRGVHVRGVWPSIGSESSLRRWYSIASSFLGANSLPEKEKSMVSDSQRIMQKVLKIIPWLTYSNYCSVVNLDRHQCQQQPQHCDQNASCLVFPISGGLMRDWKRS